MASATTTLPVPASASPLTAARAAAAATTTLVSDGNGDGVGKGIGIGDDNDNASSPLKKGSGVLDPSAIKGITRGPKTPAPLFQRAASGGDNAFGNDTDSDCGGGIRDGIDNDTDNARSSAAASAMTTALALTAAQATTTLTAAASALAATSAPASTPTTLSAVASDSYRLITLASTTVTRKKCWLADLIRANRITARGEGFGAEKICEWCVLRSDENVADGLSSGAERPNELTYSRQSGKN